MISSNNSQRSPRRPSISMVKQMSWLTRTSSHNHGHSTSLSSPIVISEPKLVHDIFTATGSSTPVSSTPTRYGSLGTGATIVRTPKDALLLSMRNQAQNSPPQENPGVVADSDSSSLEENEPPSPTSPPLPPLPSSFTSRSTPELINLTESAEQYHRGISMSPVPPRPSRTIPPTPELTRAGSVKSVLPRKGLESIPECPPQPVFAPILISSLPDVLLDLPTLMVTLDTSTSSLRTTYSTLTSRPSHLSKYLSSIVRSVQEREKHKFRDTLLEADEEGLENEDAHSLAPPDTPFASLFAAHLNSVGLVPQSAGSIQLFLDRPSAPYNHILSYLRSPSAASAILPRSAALGYCFTQERVDSLLELRDEAKYLGLEELYQLCCDEFRQFQGHVRTSTNSSIHSLNQVHEHNSTLVLPPSLDRGRARGLLQIKNLSREHQAASKMVTGHDRHSGSSSLAVSEVVHVHGDPTSPVSSQSRSRSGGDQPRSAEGWI
ncbi:hypothetical protein Clacol_001762 [Clathrus columnatus]|uniref:Uncharacterized protein n=1 Tax=Clathrus columnatus TaxID=1419009 RepID=A0AAV5A017_9AGAM|nr:hypothetical protein Clacol_001762 [Clathrus columnatus]